MGACRVPFLIGLMAVLSLWAPAAFAESEQEADVRAAFADVPAMISIARCESKYTQFGKGGTALHGGYGGRMVGIFQIYSDVHADYAKDLGMDIYTTEGNIAYARFLYQTQGTKPWLSSFPCWGEDVESAERVEETSAPAATTGVSLSVNLSMGMEHPQVLTLQKILNTNGFVLTNDGPGSPGNETNRYGALTRDAVRRFQCTQKIVCDGDEHSTGYGFVGARTRAALLGGAIAAAPQSKPDPVHSNASAPQASNDDEITRLQAQIAELTNVLNGLLATRAL